MLKRLYVDNYRSLVNFELRFGEVTLLLGPNGSGKSSVLDVVAAIRNLLDGRSKFADAFPASTLTRWQTRNDQVFEIELELEGQSFTYRLELEHITGSRPVKARLERLLAGSTVLFEFRDGEVQLYKDSNKHERGPHFAADWGESALARVAPAPINMRLSRALDAIRAVIVCSPYPHSFVPEATSEDPTLLRDGSNFAAWYRHFVQERQDLVSSYHAALASVIAGFHSLRLEKVGRDTRALIVKFDTQTGQFELRFDELSDGERALVAIYAFVHLTAGQGNCLLLDEPENYVALREIQPWLIALDDACGKTVPQAILCSHNPELIDYFGRDRCALLVREVIGGPTVVRSAPEATDQGGLRLSELVARGWEA